MSNNNEYDTASIFLAVLVFTLPLTLLIPGFSLWNVVPKIRISRFHVFSQDVSWLQLNSAIVGILVIFFCLFLEIRKRKLDDMVEDILTVSQATDATMEVERGRQAAAAKVCVELLDASTEQYEQLALLRDELQKRNIMKRQQPPAIELTPSEMCS